MLYNQRYWWWNFHTAGKRSCRRMQFYVAGIGIFLAFLLVLPWTWPIFPEDSPDMQIWTCYAIFHKLSSDRHDTCIHTDKETRPKLCIMLVYVWLINHKFVSITALVTEKSNVTKLSYAYSWNPHQHYNYCQMHLYANNMQNGKVYSLWLLAWPPLSDASPHHFHLHNMWMLMFLLVSVYKILCHW